MATLWQDLRLALRLLVTRGGFSAVVVLTLALGIGANTALFGVVHAALFREPAVRDPASLVNVYTSREDGTGYGALSYPDYRDLRDRVVLSWDRVSQQGDIAAVVAVCLPVLVILVVRLIRSDAVMTRRALPLAFAAALAASLVVNDSPNDVLTAGLVGYVVVEAVMLRDRCAALSPSPRSSPASPSSLPGAATPRS